MGKFSIIFHCTQNSSSYYFPAKFLFGSMNSLSCLQVFTVNFRDIDLPQGDKIRKLCCYQITIIMSMIKFAMMLLTMFSLMWKLRLLTDDDDDDER